MKRIEFDHYFAKVSQHKEEDGSIGFYAEFEDLPGCMTQGDSLEDVLELAKDALAEWLFVAVGHNDEIPQPVAHKGKSYYRVEIESDVLFPLTLLWARKRQGLTQVQVARRVDMTQQQYQKLEKPGANVSIKNLVRVSEALGVQWIGCLA